MNFRTLTKTYSRLSTPKKMATGVAAIAGIGALIGIPVLTLNPVRPPSVLNEDALYQSRVSNQSSSGENNDRAKGKFDSATPAEIPTDNSIPEIGSSNGGGVKKFDTSDTAGNIDDSPSVYDAAGNASSNPYSRSSSRSQGASRYTPPGSLSANPYNATSPNSTTLSTPYSLPIPKSATPYSLEPGKGNIYPEMNSKPSPNNSVSGVGASPNTPNPGAIAQ